MPEEECVICNESITNPICPECLERQVVFWIMEKHPELAEVLKSIGNSVKEFNHANTRCVICNRSMNVCPHCYCGEIFDWLRENRFHSLSKRFLLHFNYELDYRFDIKTPLGDPT